MADLHPTLKVERIEPGRWATVFRDTIAINGSGHQSVFARKRDAVAFAKFVAAHFGDRLDILRVDGVDDPRAYVTNDDRAALFGKLEELHA